MTVSFESILKTFFELNVFFSFSIRCYFSSSSSLSRFYVVEVDVDLSTALECLRMLGWHDASTHLLRFKMNGFVQ